MIRRIFLAAIVAVLPFGAQAQSVSGSNNGTLSGLTLSGGTLSGTTTLTGMTTGSVLFSGASSVLSQDNANLFWDDTNNRLGVNTATPRFSIDSVLSGNTVIAAERTDISNNNTAALQVRRSRSDATAPGLGFGSNILYVFEGFTPDSGVSVGQISYAWANAQTDDTTSRNSTFTVSTIAANTLSEKLRVSSGGSLGILNINPQANLTVGTTAGTARIYNSFTDASNGEWAYLGSWGPTANVATFGTAHNGSGVARDVSFVYDGTERIRLVTGGVNLPSLPSDATHTDNTVCADTGTGLLYKGSGAVGICLGTSSVRFKHDIFPLRPGLAQIVALQPVSYRYNKGYGDDGARMLYGFTAEQVAEVMPELVGRDITGQPNSVDWAGLVPVLVQAIQELKRQVDAGRTIP